MKNKLFDFQESHGKVSFMNNECNLISTVTIFSLIKYRVSFNVLELLTIEHDRCTIDLYGLPVHSLPFLSITEYLKITINYNNKTF